MICHPFAGEVGDRGGACGRGALTATTGRRPGIQKPPAEQGADTRMCDWLSLISQTTLPELAPFADRRIEWDAPVVAGCRASQGRIPPPLWIRSSVVGESVQGSRNRCQDTPLTSGCPAPSRRATSPEARSAQPIAVWPCPSMQVIAVVGSLPLGDSARPECRGRSARRPATIRHPGAWKVSHDVRVRGRSPA